MTEAVLDASIVIKWFHAHGEADLRNARALRERMSNGDLIAFVPPLLFLEIVNVAGRRWRLGLEQLVDLAHALEALPFEVRQPALSGVATWTSLGLSAYDAAYVALAEAERIPLVTADERIIGIAPTIARPLPAS